MSLVVGVSGTILHQLDEIIDLMEASIPANPASKQNDKLAQELERNLQQYFKMLGTAIPEDQLAIIYNRHAEKHEPG